MSHPVLERGSQRYRYAHAAGCTAAAEHGTFALPDEPGVHVFRVRAAWGDGSMAYVFAVTVSEEGEP